VPFMRGKKRIISIRSEFQQIKRFVLMAYTPKSPKGDLLIFNTLKISLREEEIKIYTFYQAPTDKGLHFRQVQSPPWGI